MTWVFDAFYCSPIEIQLEIKNDFTLLTVYGAYKVQTTTQDGTLVLNKDSI